MEKERFDRILEMQNRQLQKERERIKELEAANMIISAYFAIFLKEKGKVEVRKEEIKNNLEKYRISLEIKEDNYFLSLLPNNEKAEGYVEK